MNSYPKFTTIMIIIKSIFIHFSLTLIDKSSPVASEEARL